MNLFTESTETSFTHSHTHHDSSNNSGDWWEKWEKQGIAHSVRRSGDRVEACQVHLWPQHWFVLDWPFTFGENPSAPLLENSVTNTPKDGWAKSENRSWKITQSGVKKHKVMSRMELVNLIPSFQTALFLLDLFICCCWFGVICMKTAAVTLFKLN